MSAMEAAQAQVLKKAVPMPADSVQVDGPDFNDESLDLDGILAMYSRIGYTATALGKAVEEIKRMLDWRLSDDEPIEDDSIVGEARAKVRAKVFFGYTSNLVSSGLQPVIRWLVEHKMIDVMVSTAGGIEEDIIKCLAPTYIGTDGFKANGTKLREQGLNRIGNLIVPNDNYCAFEDWIVPVLDRMLEDQRKGYHWTPSRMIWRLGKEINDPRSICYWAYKNQIPVFSPALTDGSIGDMLFFHSHKNP
ncbi:deoxyhypusine synthase, partial [Kipferlia bialata]|eukprot:g8952.t1